MKFDDIDNKMRQYEKSLDQVITEGNYIVARLDGRSFTRLTKDTCKFEAPFDERFRDLMVDTVKYLMENSGFRVRYGYTESDEISLLFDKDDTSFGRKVRKINTTLAGEASAYFSMRLKELTGKTIVASFDCRVCPLPNMEVVKEYFAWRQEDSHRNSLNGWCYWTLRKEGFSKGQATSMLSGKGNAFKNELLFERGINYNDLPGWQKAGVGVSFLEVEKEGYNPITGETVAAKRKVLVTDCNLPYGANSYGDYIEAVSSDVELRYEEEDYEVCR